MFLPGPGEIPFNHTHLKSDMYESDLYETRIKRQVFPVTTDKVQKVKVWVVRKSELYECFRRSLAIRITQVYCI